MITTLNQSLPSPVEWKDYLSEENEQKQQNAALWWNRAQTVTITALCVLGVSILLFPYVLPITYTSILMNAFAIIPLLMPIPGYFYSYCVLQATQANEACKKIIFFRKEHLKIEKDPKILTRTIEQTFAGHLSKEKKLFLQQPKEMHTPIICHLTFLENELKTLEKEKETLYESIRHYKEQDLDALVNNPLLSESKDLILKEKINWVTKQKKTISKEFLQSLITILEKDSSNNLKSIFEVKKIYWNWSSKEACSLTEKWTPLFLLEEKILLTKIHQLFLWTFLFLPQENLSSSLKNHNLHIENSLFDHKIKKNTLSLPDFTMGKMYEDPATETVLILPNGALSKKEILDPKLKEQALDKFLHSLKPPVL